MILIGIDTGGTFTDFIYKDGEQWGVYKLLSTPSNPAEAVLAGIRHVAGDRSPHVVHGSTVATNALLERKGVRTALITNSGFEDVLVIGRQNRHELYSLNYRREPPLVPEHLRFGVAGRISSSAEELIPFDVKRAEEVAKHLGDSGVESAAVCFLFSYLNPEHERQMGEILKRSEIPVSLSHKILAEFREYERLVTTVINAYVSPKMERYLADIAEEIGSSNLRIMQSNGGSISAETAMTESVRTILSGPAGGAVGAFEIARRAGFSKIISFDMGGTSTDVALIDGKLPLTFESQIAGYPVKVPMIDIHTVGAGGGSIAIVDVGGALKVGPESAGADPGPICYGKGNQITVTDANLFLGRLVADRFLGGEMVLHTERLAAHFEQMAARIRLSPVELAEGVLAVANTAMERAIRVISVERGFDPREFTLFSFGGAGGMHAAFLARFLNIPRVLIPRDPGILSAVGMLMADIIRDYSLTVMLNQDTADRTQLDELFVPLEKKGIEELMIEGIAKEAVVLEKYLDMRYRGQSYEIVVPFSGNYIGNFHALHEKSYGYRNPGRTVEIVNIRLRARGVPEKPEGIEKEPAGAEMVPEAVLEERDAIFDQQVYSTKIIARDRLLPGNRIPGPAVVVEYSATTVIPPFASGQVDGYGNLILHTE